MFYRYVSDLLHAQKLFLLDLIMPCIFSHQLIFPRKIIDENMLIGRHEHSENTLINEGATKAKPTIEPVVVE